MLCRVNSLKSIFDAVEHLQAGDNVGKPVVKLCDDALPASAPPPPLGVAEAPDDGPPVRSMERVLELRSDAYAEDVEVTEEMVEWSEARLVRWFENGGA